MADAKCPVLQLQPVLAQSDVRTIEHNNQQVIDWARRICAYIDGKQGDGGDVDGGSP